MLLLWFLLFLDLATGTTAFFCFEKRIKHTFLPFVVSLLSSFIVCPGYRMEESDLMKERLQAITVSFYYKVVINYPGQLQSPLQTRFTCSSSPMTFTLL